MATGLRQEARLHLRRRHLRVLIVEDSVDDYELLVHTLSRGGFDVYARQVLSKEELIQALDTGPWDVILMDWVLSQFSAPEGIRILRERGNSTPCIVTSAGPGDDLAVLAIKLGANDFISKLRLDALAPSIHRELLFAESQAPTATAVGGA